MAVFTGLTLTVPLLGVTTLNAGQGLKVGHAVTSAGPVAVPTASSANGMYTMAPAGSWKPWEVGPLDERAMSTQPACGVGVGAAPPFVVFGFMAQRRADTPSPEPLGRAKLQFAVAEPSTGVMISWAALVTGLVAL